MSDKPKFCTMTLHYIGRRDGACACGQLLRVQVFPDAPCPEREVDEPPASDAVDPIVATERQEGPTRDDE